MKDWASLQQSSAKVLNSGLTKLLSQSERHAEHVLNTDSGTYLVSVNGLPVYAGEAVNLAKRVKQQFSSRSTFFKNYLRYTGEILPDGLEVNSFKVRVLPVAVGRKELEEFAIVELGLPLNKAMGRRDNTINYRKEASEVWEQAQVTAKNLIQDGSQIFLNGQSVTWGTFEPPKLPGVYRVHQADGGIIYIGESSDLRRRYRNHSTHSRSSALRRHIGTELLGLAFERRMTLSKDGERQVNALLSHCTVFGSAINFGRYELEDWLIKSQHPLLNRKGKK